jgi:hypothetical protein
MPITNPDWIPPIEMDFDVGKPIRSEQGVQLAGNPIAIIQSADGAPRPLTVEQFKAAQPFVVAAGEVVLGPFVHSGNFTSASRNGSTYESAGSITVLPNVSGVIRFRASYGGGGSTVTEISLLRNGSEVFFFRGVAGVSGTQTADISASSGDVFEWQVRRTSGSTGTATISPEPPRGNDTIEGRLLYTYVSQAS